jgi:hypothetical protein
MAGRVQPEQMEEEHNLLFPQLSIERRVRASSIEQLFEVVERPDIQLRGICISMSLVFTNVTRGLQYLW